MSATIDASIICQALQATLIESEGRMFPIETIYADRRHTSGTADQKLSLILWIEIQHIGCLQILCRDACCAEHTDFLVHSDYNFECRMRNIGSIQNGKCKRNGNSFSFIITFATFCDANDAL